MFRQLSAAAKSAILDKHNELRRRVAKGEETNGLNGVGQPAAANMKKMVWNAELEAVAQRWADQCKFGHDKKREKLDGTYVRQFSLQRQRHSAEIMRIMMTLIVSVVCVRIFSLIQDIDTILSRLDKMLTGAETPSRRQRPRCRVG